MGVAGAGKSVVGSAFADAIGVAFVDGDDYHPRRNVEKMAAGIPLTDEDRAEWLGILGARLRAAHDAGEGLVVACSALKRAYRDVLRDTAGTFVRFVHLRGDRALIADRLGQRRGHFMPASLLDSQLATLEEPASDEQAWTFDVRATPQDIVAALCVLVSEQRS
jgi:gluconokinase